MVLNLVLAESALETIPSQLWRDPLIRRYSEKRGKEAEFLLLDRSYHHAAMKNLLWSERRGRPDIVHFSLLEALGSPLTREGLLQVYVHTISNCIVSINPETRLPRNYNRFVGLFEQLFKLEQIPSNGPALLTLVKNTTLPKLVKRIKPDYTIAFSRAGTFKTLQECISAFADKKNPLVIVGGFPHGPLSSDSLKVADEVVAIDREMLETWTLTARIVYEYEKLLNLPIKRLIPK